MGLSSLIYQHSPNWVRTVMLNIFAYSLNVERYGKKFEMLLNEFERNENLSRAELEEYQREKLLIMISHVYEHVPYYRAVMDGLKLCPKDFNDLTDIQKLPILRREDVKSNYAQLQADNIPRYNIRHGHTSGTTGSPLRFLWDISVCVAHHAADWRQKQWAGFRFGEPFVSLQGRQIVPFQRSKQPFWVMNHIHNQLFMSSFHLKDEFMGAYIEKIKQFRPKGVEGYPSSLYILARYLKKNNMFCPVPAVLTSSETLLPIQRELIEDRFQCKVYDFYGMSERTIFATECKFHSGKHLNLDYGITEVVDKDNNVLRDGDFGTIVATSLWNFAMPLIRYKTSDASFILLDKCPCGSSFPLMNQVTTKQEDIIILTDGKMVPSSILTHPFKPLDNILKSQIIQNTMNSVCIKIVKGDRYTVRDEAELLKGIQERLGDSVDINIKYVRDIPNDKSGKFRWVISKVQR
ncbi:MAG: phenylacetate--CoA ligase family protein [Eubacteriaceae bacterium]|nr:phenylacetate--CoA ligase family protein [Eubacteriaceae bacterium]